MGARTGREGALTAPRAAGAMVAAVALGAGALFASTLAYPAPASAKGASSGAALVVKTEHVAKLGTVLTTGAGLTLYSYGVDPAGQATCTGACAKAWPPLLLPKGVTRIEAPHGVKGLTAIRVKGGRLQVFFHDHALYHFVSDTKKGEATGQGVENEWFAVLSDGKSSAVTSGLRATPAGGGATSTSTSTSTSTTSPTASKAVGTSTTSPPTTVPSVTKSPPATSPSPTTAPPTTAPPTTVPPTTTPPTSPPTTTTTTAPPTGGAGF